MTAGYCFRYNMVLNLLRVEELNPEYMLKNCFYQFQNQQALPQKEGELAALAAERDAIKVEQEPLVEEYYQIRTQLDLLAEQLRAVVSFRC